MASGSNKSAASSFPTSVTVLGQEFRIELLPAEKMDGNFGEMVGELHRIRICDTQDRARRWRTLLHEVVHAVLYVNGVSNTIDEDQEEVIAQSLEYGMLQFMQQYGDEYMANAVGERE